MEIIGWIFAVCALIGAIALQNDLKKDFKLVIQSYAKRIKYVEDEMVDGFELKNKAIRFLTDENEKLRKEINQYPIKFNPNFGKKISKNCIQGDRITNLNTLFPLALNGKSIYHPNWGRKPAGFIIGMNFIAVSNAIRNGDLYHVINKTKEN